MSSSTQRLDVQILETSFISPVGSSASSPKTVPLSIIDATAANFGYSAAVWLYAPSPSHSRESPLSISRLRSSLIVTLSTHPWLAGQLHWAHSETAPFAATTHATRFRRLAITYGNPSCDPGVMFAAAVCPTHKITELIPSNFDRGLEWDPASRGFDAQKFLPDFKNLAFSTLGMYEKLPCAMIQMTEFSCGSVAIGVAISHQLADAHGLSNFVHDWSGVNSSIFWNEEVPQLSPILYPELLDAKAAGDIESSAPHSGILSRARRLPCHRFDYWAGPGGEPIQTAIPRELKTRPSLIPEHGTAIPWHEWDYEAPVSHSVVHFTAQEIEAMYAGASSKSGMATSVSRHDVLLAHIWHCINVARFADVTDRTEVYLNITLGLRKRLGLPDTFVGSPIINIHVAKPASDLASLAKYTMSEIASDIHATIARFSTEAIGDLLHDAAFDVCPHRLWQAFLGPRHVLATSWIHVGMYENTSFGVEGEAGTPWYVQPVIAHYDGFVQILEARPQTSVKLSRWYEAGVDVAVTLTAAAMKRLLEGPELRRYKRVPLAT